MSTRFISESLYYTEDPEGLNYSTSTYSPQWTCGPGYERKPLLSCPPHRITLLTLYKVRP